MPGKSSCSGAFSCRGSGVEGSFAIADGACAGDYSCFGSIGSATIGSASCHGVVSCAFLAGKTTIHPNACDGTNSCSGLLSSTIGMFFVVMNKKAANFLSFHSLYFY